MGPCTVDPRRPLTCRAVVSWRVANVLCIVCASLSLADYSERQIKTKVDTFRKQQRRNPDLFTSGDPHVVVGLAPDPNAGGRTHTHTQHDGEDGEYEPAEEEYEYNADGESVCVGVGVGVRACVCMCV